MLFITASKNIDFIQLKSPYYVRTPGDTSEDDFRVDQMSFVNASKYPEQAKRIFMYNQHAHHIMKENPHVVHRITNYPNNFNNFLRNCFLVFEGNKLIGHVRFYLVANDWEISCSYAILPGSAGQGLGTKLLANIKQYCKSNFSDKYRYISLYIKHDNKASLRIAEKNGFKKQNKTPSFSRDMCSFKLIIEI